MGQFNWRSSETYNRAQPLEPTGLAWEYLRRNPDYRRDYHQIVRASSDPRLIEKFRTRWGLCFCG